MRLNRREFLSLVSLSGLGAGFLHNRTLAQSSQLDNPTDPAWTSPLDPPLLRFVAVGDVGTGEQAQYDVAHSMLRFHQRQPFPFAFLTGDNIYDGGDIQRIDQVFEQPYQGLLQHKVQFHAILGNHDVMSNQGQDQIRYPGFNMQGRYYTFAHGPVQFFALDTNPGHHWSAQLPWFKRELAQSNADWKIVLGHHPLYASGLHSIKQRLAKQLGPLLGQSKAYPGLADQLTPLFTQYGVQLYINGHEHHYERTHAIAGTTYLTCGVGARLRPTGSSTWTAFASSQLGFAVIDIYADQLIIKGIGVNGIPFDQGNVLRQAHLDSNSPLL
ncbi:metallophosphoesterase [Acaryochloris sp. IP29b_bin.148]|uniref:metallophosphoesterase family protein n=1 Tax=Acaryochloris sp. IP29b_bin.148 TaxID=2969218 RepID=UPI0026344C97|nr:metallophosphoesterase [Acaryochloris sp. IP29b_bin.148]